MLLMGDGGGVGDGERLASGSCGFFLNPLDLTDEISLVLPTDELRLGFVVLPP